MDRPDHSLQHIGLATACAVIYATLTGLVPDPRNPAGMQAILNDVAHALASVAAIYADDPESGMPREIAPGELVTGRFSRGAHVFTTGDGRQMGGLTVRRRDMRNAISILRFAQVDFRKPPED